LLGRNPQRELRLARRLELPRRAHDRRHRVHDLRLHARRTARGQAGLLHGCALRPTGARTLDVAFPRYTLADSPAETSSMRVDRIRVKNWRNFTDVDVQVQSRTFIVGANASGKSNFLDIFRFLRDIASASGGGLQKAIKDRGGMPKVRSLAARRNPNVLIDLDLSEGKKKWRYFLEITQQTSGKRRPIVKSERVHED